MNHFIENNNYYITDEDGQVIFSIKLTDKPGDQIIIETAKEVYAGPISFISFWNK